MAKRIYQVGEPCDVCGTATVVGKGGTGYCKPCYIAWKNSSEALKPAVQGYNPASVQTPIQPTIVPQSVTDALLKIATHLNNIDQAIERNRWYSDEILKKLDPKWSSLSQDDVKLEDLPL
jgi:hypothetical protein